MARQDSIERRVRRLETEGGDDVDVTTLTDDELRRIVGNADRYAGIMRSLSDDQLRAIVRGGGMP